MCRERRISVRQLSRTLVHRKTCIAAPLGAHSLEAQERSGRWHHIAAVEMGWMDTVLQNVGVRQRIAHFPRWS